MRYLARMTAVAFAVLGSHPLAAAPVCPAVDRLNAASDEVRRWYEGQLKGANIEATVGTYRADLQMDAVTCPKLFPIWNELIPRTRALAPLERAALQCGRLKGDSSSQVIDSINQAVARCNQIVAESAKSVEEFRTARRADDERQRQAGTLPPDGAMPRSPGSAWRGTADPADCANANDVERGTAAWGYMCAQSGAPQTQQPAPQVVPSNSSPPAQQTVLVRSSANKPSPLEPIRNLAAQLGNDFANQLPPADMRGQQPPPQPKMVEPRIASAPTLPPSSSAATEAPQRLDATPSCYGGPLVGDCGTHWQGTDDPDDCARANDVERSSAAWGLACAQRWQGSSDPQDCGQANKKERDTKKWQDACGGLYPSQVVKPDQLIRLAQEKCPLSGQPGLRQQAGCMAKFKLGYLLANEPAVRAECSDLSKLPKDINQSECVDAVYVYGAGALGNERLMLRLKLNEDSNDRLPNWIKDLPDDPDPQKQVDGCAVGFGLKQDSKASGAYRCQPLGNYVLDVTETAAAPAGSIDDATARDAAERRINRTVKLLVAVVAERVGRRLSDADRKTCMAEAFAAARATLKGGVPTLSPTCREFAIAVVGELAYYQGTSPIIIIDPDNDTLLSVLSGTNANTGGTIGGNLGSPMPGMTGIEPSAEDRRQADCIANGGTRERCMASSQTSAEAAKASSTTTPAADCKFAKAHWEVAEDIKKVAIYQDHLEQFPNCQFAALARQRIDALQQR